MKKSDYAFIAPSWLRLIKFLARNLSTMSLRLAALVVDAVGTVVAELVLAGQVAVYCTAESWADLQLLNVFKQVFFLALTELASSRALQLVISDFMAKASVQQVQESSVLQVVTFSSKLVMVSEQLPVKVELMVISSQLDSMLELQLDKVDPSLAALVADLPLAEQVGLVRFPPTASVRIAASLAKLSFFSFFFLTMLAWLCALFSCFLKL